MVSDTVLTIALVACIGIVFVLGCVLDKRRSWELNDKPEPNEPPSHVRILVEPEGETSWPPTYAHGAALRSSAHITRDRHRAIADRHTDNAHGKRGTSFDAYEHAQRKEDNTP